MQRQNNTHAADPEGNDLLKGRAGIKRSAKDTAEKTHNIIKANIAGLQENVLARRPRTETIWRDVRRNRPNNHPAIPEIYDLGQQFLVYDNGRPDRILLLDADKGFCFLSNSQ